MWRLKEHTNKFFAVNTAVDGVYEAIAMTRFMRRKKRPAQNALAFGSERQSHRIVHPAGQHRFEAAVVWPSAENMGCAAFEFLPVGKIVSLFRKCTFAPINPSIRPEIRPVQIIGATGKRLAFVPFFADIRNPVAVGVGEFPDARRRGDVERTVMPKTAFREHHFVRENHVFIEFAIPIGVFEADDAMRFVFELFFRFVVRTGRIGEVQPALFIK